MTNTRVATICPTGFESMARLARHNLAALMTAGFSVVKLPDPDPCSWVYHHGNPGQLPLVDGKRVAFWSWELPDRIPSDWLDASADFEQVWVPSPFVMRSLVKGGVDPIKLKVIPPFATFGTMVPLHKRKPSFITAFDGRDNLECKNPWAVIDAFRIAFPKGVDVSLTIKAQGLEPPEMAEFIQATKKDERISLYEGGLDEPSLIRLFKDHAAFISLSRAEAYGPYHLLSASIGLPIITPLHGGVSDLLDFHTCYPVGHASVKARNHGVSGGTWIEPDVDHAAIQMVALAKALRSGYVQNMVQGAYRNALLNHSYLNTVKAIQQATSLL